MRAQIIKFIIYCCVYLSATKRAFDRLNYRTKQSQDERFVYFAGWWCLASARIVLGRSADGWIAGMCAAFFMVRVFQQRENGSVIDCLMIIHTKSEV